MPQADGGAPAGATPAPQSSKRPHWRPPIWAALLAGFGGVTAAAASLLLVSLSIAATNTYELTRQVAEQRIGAMINDLRGHLRPARAAVEFLAEQIGTGTVPIEDEQRLQDVLLGSLAAVPQLAGIAFVRDDLYAVRAGRGEMGGFGASAGSWVDRPEIRLQVRDGATRPEFVWGDVIYIKAAGLSVVVLRKAVVQGTTYRGVVVAAVSIGELSGFLDETDGPIPSHPFILKGRDDVLAHPALAGGPRGLSREKPLPRLGEIGDPVLASLWSPPVDDVGDLLAGSDVSARVIAAGGTEYVVLYRQLDEYGSTPWMAGMSFRRADVDAPARRLRFAEFFGAGALLLSLALAFLIGRGLSHPLRRLAGAAQAIRDLEIERSKPLPGNLFREIDTAAKAYNAMLAGLRWFETYVPKALVLMLMREGARGELLPEERIVTVLFTDIAGFTGIGTRLSAPQLARFLNRHFGLLARCIEAENGTLDKYIGDSVMAFWGAPFVQPDHALRACRAALAIAETLRADNERRAAAKGLAPVRLRIGIHTGPAIVGNVGAPGRINYTLIGDTVNTAQRLEQYAKTIATGAPSEHAIAVIGDTTAEAVKNVYQLTPLGEVELRGRDETMKVYRLV